HWSLYPDGPAVSVEETAVNSDTCFYANFAEDYVTYTISFSACGEIFYSLSLPYQSAISFPEAPLKPADAVFRYSFSHWSMKENGAPLDTAAITVQQDTTFYAVYAQTDVNIWDGISADVFSDGDGSAEKPYEIKNGYQLYYLSCHLADSPALAAAHYLLIRDIDLGGNEWLPIGTLETPFTGTFDGSGYTVSNFKITSDETAALGLFGCIANADISRLAVSDFDITVTADKQTELYAGTIAGIMTADVTGGVARLTECSSDGAIYIYAELTYAGGLVGKAACTDDAYIYLENSYSRCAVTAHSEKLSMAGGIAGTFHAQSSGASCMDRSYAVGTVAALSETAAYAGGIVGFLYDDGGYIDGLVSLNAAETGTVRNCFAAGSASAQTDSGLSCYAGYIYAYKNQPATVTGCAAYASMNVSGAAIADTEGLLLETELASFYDRDFLAGLGFDVESIWTVPDNDFPTLSTADTVKNVYRVLSAVFNPAQGTMSVSLYIGYRDVASYTVLAGAYDERGKMIGFRAVTVTDPERLQTIELSLDGIEKAVSAKVSVVDSASFALLENVLSWEN
ncbi:MAG: hypothetical protein ACI4RV_07370, partial [Eubacteriales bacterium]